MAEAILFSLVEEIIKNLGSRTVQEIGLWCGVKDELEKLKRTVLTIQAVLLDAEEKCSTNNQVKVWLQMLKEVVYDADDLLDDFSTEVLRRQVMTGNRIMKEVRLFFSHSNQLIYAVKMAHKIKNIRERLVEISENRKFHLEKHLVELPIVIPKDREQTHSSLPEVVAGRENDKQSIIDFLVSFNSKENVSIISIVGIGGLGKTTLAQLTYNDDKVNACFDLKLWVCVSNNFDVKLILEKILESATGDRRGNLEMDTLKNLLHGKISGKKYLLVLDDVWNEDYEKWSKLKDLLIGGIRGSRIIVTTRLKHVAQMIRSDSIYELQGLSDNEAWSLFKKMAFKEGQVTSLDHFKVGKEIVAKCAGVPLAIRAIGGLLYFKSTIVEWQFFKDREFSNLNDTEISILSTLRLSYDHLPSHLKSCFAYCKLFPKDCRINVGFLVQLWVAQGFIKSVDPKQSLEETGSKYFRELLWRSFFQDIEEDTWRNITYCKMHDLIYDLVVVVGGEVNTLLDSNVEIVYEGTRHLSIGYNVDSWSQIAPFLRSARKLRTLLYLGGNGIKEEELDAIFSSLRKLRVLYLSNLGIERVPPSIERLKHVRYLDLSLNKGIEILPDSLCRLQNLQTLVLSYCERLKQLPKHFKMLVNLRQLYIDGCVSLIHMPRGLGQLTLLRILPMFIVAKDNGISKQSCGLDELHDLNSLGDALRICNLRYVRNAASKFEAANLKEKQHLQSLMLAWKLGEYDDTTNTDPNEVDNDNEEISLEGLLPHINLKCLFLYGCGRLKCPSWVSSLTNLVELKIDNCKKCQLLPPLDQLFSLKRLAIHDSTDLEYIETENQMSGSELFFPSLENLWLSNCPNLKGWLRPELLQFHCLHYLEIKSCPNLTSMPLIPSVGKLVVENASVKSLEDILKVKISVSQSTSSSSLLSAGVSRLKFLTFEKIEGLEFLPEELMQNLTSLQQLDIIDCPKITTLPRAIQHLTSLKVLIMESCKELEFSDDCENESGIMQWECLKSLEQIQFRNMPKLVSLPKGLQRVPNLLELFVQCCPNLMCLPEWMPNLTPLQYLDIENCPQLSERCSSNMGIDWPKIAHIPDIYIDGRYIQDNGCCEL